jgi:hypothetical protein
MTFLPPSRALLCALLGLCAGAAFAADSAGVLSCEDDGRTERTALRRTPDKVKRPATHLLLVVTAKGPHRFTDKPPYDEPLAGVKWRYCGYDAQAQAHLIGKDDEGTFTGVLLLDDSGAALPAGKRVVFAPNRQAFLASEQPDGLDGENWSVAGIDGKTIWKGYAGMPAKAPGEFLSQFTAPYWTARGELRTRYTCAGPHALEGDARLIRSADGQWRWHTQGACPAK